MDRLPVFVFAAAAFGITLSQPASGAEVAASAAADSDDQESIVVTGERGQYGASATSTATKTDTPIRNIPQALTIVSESQIEDQQLRSIADLLNFVPGATPGTGEANRDQMTLRGNNTTADFFVDGIRDDVQYFRDLYNVERVEVLKGPNSMIFGRGGGGGIVNRVIKRGSFIPQRKVTAAGDGFGGYRTTADFNQPVGGAGLRLNAMYENGESFRRDVELERYAVNPTAAFSVGPETRLDLGYEYLHDRRTTDRGVPSDGNRPIKGFDRTFFGDPDDSFAKADVKIASFGVEHRFGDFTLRNRSLAADYDKFYQNIYPSNYDEAAGEVVLNAYNNRNDRTNLFTQTDLIWKGAIGGIEQTVLVGFELGRQKSRNLRQSGSFAGSNRVPVSDPTIDADVTFAPSASDADNRVRANIASVYAQDQVRLSPVFEIVAGLRVERFDLDIDDLRASGGEFSRTDTLFSPRLGLIAKPTDRLSLYASYSRSFLPQSGDQFSGLTSTSEQLKPERFDNYEIGAKWEPVDGLLATAAIYQLDRTNTQARDAFDRVVLTGAQRSRGLELGLERNITSRWQVSAGYAWQDAEIVQSTASAPEGRRVPLVPRHSLSAWTRYDVGQRLGVGLGVLAHSKSYASISNAVTLPGYARVDGALFYTVMPGVEAQVNVENLFGADYFPTAHNDNNIAPGAPRSIKASIGYRF